MRGQVLCRFLVLFGLAACAPTTQDPDEEILPARDATNSTTAADPPDPAACGDVVPTNCPIGKTGRGCALTCDATAGADCAVTEYCDSSGRHAGLFARRAFLFRSPPDAVDQAFAAWVTEHPEVFGLQPDTNAAALRFERAAVSRHGRFFLVRLSQKYRDLPILGREASIVLSGHGDAVSLVNGTIVDSNRTYANLDRQCTAEQAAEALRHYAANSPADAHELALADFELHAMVGSERIVWAAYVLRNGVPLGRFAVDAAPVASGERPALVYRDEGVHAGLGDEVPIGVWSLDLAKAAPYDNFDALPHVENDSLATGSPLLGSTVEGSIHLGTGRVLMRDLHGLNVADGILTSTRIVQPDGKFLATEGPEVVAQRFYHLLQSFYDVCDRYLSAPGDLSLKQWDSHRGDESTCEPGTFQPRVVVFVNSGEKCRDQPACVSSLPIGGEVPPEMYEFVHQAEGAHPTDDVKEVLGVVHFVSPVPKIDAFTVAHEFGHVVDLFLGPGFSLSDACMIGVDCVAKCVEDTPDEGPPLVELIANLVALLLWYETSPLIEDGDCSAVEATVASAVRHYGETPGPCMAALGQIAFMVRDDVCPVMEPGFCDKPNADDLGFRVVCCELGVDPACVEPSSGCGDMGGGIKSLPTGGCTEGPGYRSNSTLEAYWQLLTGKVCAPVAPFACTPIALPSEVSPSEAAARALFYALRTAPHWYRQLFEQLAAYYACEYGEEAFLDVRDVLCNHLIMDCDAPMPVQCSECGDARIDAGEECDGSAIPISCEELGFAGGEMACTADCALNTEGCILLVPTEGDVETDDGGTSELSSTSSVDSATTPGGAESGGCDCRVEASSSGFLAVLSLLIFRLTTQRGRRRRL